MLVAILRGEYHSRSWSNFPHLLEPFRPIWHCAGHSFFKIQNLKRHGMEIGRMSTIRLMKTLIHLAIGPLVGAILAGLLLIVLMLHVNNGEASVGQNKREKHACVSVSI